MAGMKVLLSLLALAVVPAFAVNYDISWSSGADYSTWASDKTIRVGDTVTFQYGGLHSVDEVSSADYQSCSSSSTLSSDSSGSTVITLSQPGTRYFICSTSGHCAGGMKVAIPVSAAATSPVTPSTPSGTPSGSGSTPPTDSSGSGTPPTPKSSGTPNAAAGFQPSKAAALVGALLAGGLAFLG